MHTFFKTLYSTVALSLTLLLLQTAPAIADDAAKPTLTQVGFVAAKSVDAATAFAKLAGFDLPPNMSADGLEQQFPFIGKGGLATDQPIGIAFCGGPELKDPQQGIVFVFPVKAGAATLDSFKAQGGTPVADHPDTMLMGGAGLRRTADFLIFSPMPAAVSVVDTAPLTEAVKGGDALVKVSIDLKAVRKNMPDQYKQFLDMASSGAGADKAAALAPILKTLESIDRFAVSLDNGEKGIRLAFTTTPFKLPALTGSNKPGMPAGVLARYDLGASVLSIYPAAKDAYATLVKSLQDDATANKGKPFTDDQKKQVGVIMSKVGTLLMEPSVTSIGVEMIAGDPVVYVVQHWSKPMDVTKEVQEIVGLFDAMAKDTDPGHTIAMQTYSSDGVHVLRLVFMDDTKSVGHADIVQKGDDVFVSISPNAYRYVHKLMAAKDEGPIASVYSASLDLEKLAVALGNGPNAPLAGMPADTRKQLVDLLQGQKVMLATAADGDGATVELTVGKGLVQNFPKLAALFGLSSPPVSAVPSPAVPEAPKTPTDAKPDAPKDAPAQKAAPDAPADPSKPAPDAPAPKL